MLQGLAIVQVVHSQSHDAVNKQINVMIKMVSKAHF